MRAREEETRPRHCGSAAGLLESRSSSRRGGTGAAVHLGSLRPTIKVLTMRLVLRTGLCTALALAGASCVSAPRSWRIDGWYADFEAAEAAAAIADKDLLIRYWDDREDRGADLDRAMREPGLSELASGRVCCNLFRSCEPDRRYVAQFGVDRAPALIVVHRDGTYHARTGQADAKNIEAFLAEAQPPGSPIATDPYVPRQADYKWLGSFEEAESAARDTGRPMFLVYYRTLSRDWHRLSEMLERPEARLRLAQSVGARIGVLGFSTDATITRFGALRLPAIVIAHADGTFKKLELPQSYEDVVRFADASLSLRPQTAATLAPAGAVGAAAQSTP